MTIRTWIALCVGLLLVPNAARALDPARTIGQFHHVRFSGQEGAPGDVSAIVQAPDGYILLATRDGLYRFDGVSFERVERPPSAHIEIDQVRNLLALRTGEVLVGYNSGPLALYRDGRLRELPGRRFLGDPIALVEDRRGRIWGNFNHALAYYAGGQWIQVALDRPRFTSRITDLLAAKDGTLWIVTLDTVAFIPDGDTRIHDTGAVISGRTSLAQDASGRIWITTGLDSVRLMPDYLHGARPSTASLARSNTIVTQHILFDRDGVLWGVSPDGVFRIPALLNIRAGAGAPTVQHFGAQDGLTSDAATSVYEDREGDVWVGTRMGLDMFRAAILVKPSALPAVPYGYSIPVSEPSIFADAHRLYSVDRDGSRQTPIGSALKGYISCLCNTADGSTYVGQVRQVTRITNGVLSNVPVEPLVFSLCASDGNAVWFTLQQNGIAHIENDRVTYFPPPATYSDDNWSESILATPVGVVAYFHNIGLVRVDVHPWRVIATQEAIGVGQISALAYGDGLLVGGYRGLARLRGGRLDRLTARDHPWLQDTGALARSPKGDIWIFSHGGLTRVTTAALGAAFSSPTAPLNHDTFDMRDGLPSPANNRIYGYLMIARDGRVWITTTEGVAWMDPDRIVRNDLAPPVSIRAVTANGRRVADPRTLSLAPGTNNVEIDYTALSFTEPSRVGFRYKLDGVDSDWVDPGQRRQAFYTRLGPGNYTFHVIASNNDGVWNRTGAILTFAILPTFYQSTTFLVFCLLGGLTLLWLLYALRLRQVATRFRTLLHERLDERERIARELHDTLLQGFQGVMLHFRSIAEHMSPGDPARPLIGSALERAEAVLVEGRDRVRNLRSTTEHADLADRLAEAGNKLTVGSKTKFRLTVEGKQPALHPIVRDEIGKIAEEAIFNAFQHAQAREIEVGLVFGRQALSLKVCDDGVGMDSAILDEGREGHFGLVGMRERATKLNAEIKLETRPGAGTEIALTVPASVAYAVSGSRGAGTFFRRRPFEA